MEDDLEETDTTISAYDQLLRSMSSARGRTGCKILRKRKKQLKMAHTEMEDRKLDDFEAFAEEGDLDSKEEDVKEELSDEESDIQEEEQEQKDVSHMKKQQFKDPFKIHFEHDLLEDQVEEVKQGILRKEEFQNDLGSSVTSFETNHELPKTDVIESLDIKSLTDVKVVKKVAARWMEWKKKEKELLTPLQKELFKYIGSYKDVMFTERTFSNEEQIRSLYCMHAVNHIMKTRSRILKNNEKIVQAQKEGKELEDIRDHGLTRPKVLIVVPFRESCLRIVNQIIKFSVDMDGKAQVMQKKRFYDEYKLEVEENRSKVSYVPEDFKAMFAGNIDDCFRIGITIQRRAVRLFADFYSADIIIASPLGLRMIIGAEGDSERDFDFLSSVEVLIVDQVDVFQMQNWEHVPHFLDHMHLQPKATHDADFTRVRMWTLNGWSPFYRQTILLSSFQTPEINSLFNKFCRNYAGKVKIQASSYRGSIQQVVTQLPQVFHKVDCDTHLTVADKRFNYFVGKILPEFRSKLTNRIGIFVPSYFDFVRLRNYFKKNDVNFLQINEYSERNNISRARTLFNEGKRQFLLFTERFYFFYRYRLKGMRHIIFYELPQYPVFYPEILNFLQTGNDPVAKAVGITCTVIYSKFDRYKVENVVGSTRSKQMLTSKKNVHMLVSEGK